MMVHYSAAKKVLHYLAEIKTHRITYSKKKPEFQRENLFYRYANTGYATAEGYCLVSGYIFLSGGSAIIWCSQKQSTIVMSTTEAEYVALSEAA